MRTRNGQRWARGVALAFVLVALGAGSAAADSIPYFDGPGRIGFENDLGLVPELNVASQLSVPGLVFKQKFKKVKFKNGIYTVRLKLNVKNRTGSTLDDVLLLISALAQPSYIAPDTPIRLDLGGGKVSEVSIARLQGSPKRFFAALDVGRLFNKKKFQAQIEYQVLGDLERGRPSTLQFTIGTSPMPIPEPGTALLLGGGLALLIARRRSRLAAARR